MRRAKLLAVVTFAVVAVGVALALLIPRDSNSVESIEQVSTFNGIVAEYRGTEPCEVIVDLGYVTRSATANETIRLVNRSDSPILLLDYSTQCRCMWLEFERKPIAPNESIDITLTFDSRGEWGSVGNYMEITTSKETAPVVLWIGAEIE
ncbi:MAG: DUF1573 domain-containing protein [Alistipes sp.]|nr:DUF1573 domain-containing protein [Alistipes sp.]